MDVAPSYFDDAWDLDRHNQPSEASAAWDNARRDELIADLVAYFYWAVGGYCVLLSPVLWWGRALHWIDFTVLYWAFAWLTCYVIRFLRLEGSYLERRINELQAREDFLISLAPSDPRVAGELRDRATCHHDLGLALEHNHPQRALQEYRLACELNPQNPDYREACRRLATKTSQ
jgi:hypothetical protein